MYLSNDYDVHTVDFVFCIQYASKTGPQSFLLVK